MYKLGKIKVNPLFIKIWMQANRQVHRPVTAAAGTKYENNIPTRGVICAVFVARRSFPSGPFKFRCNSYLSEAIVSRLITITCNAIYSYRETEVNMAECNSESSHSLSAKYPLFFQNESLEFV